MEALETPTRDDSTGVGEKGRAPHVVTSEDFGDRLPCCLEERLKPLAPAAIDATVAGLAAGAEHSLQRLAAWTLEFPYPESISHIGKELFDGAPLSVNLPLHRAAGAFLQVGPPTNHSVLSRGLVSPAIC